MAHGIPILWAERDGERDETKINGSAAVSEMIKFLKEKFGDVPRTAYTYVIF